jgi:signal transduction histidine kinase
MRRNYLTFGFQAAVWAGLMLATLPALAQPAAAPLVLVLNSYDESTAPYARAREVFALELEHRSDLPVLFRQYDLDERKDTQESRDQIKAQLLRISYLESPPDLVVAIGPPAIDFWLEHRDSVFPEAPLMAVTAEFVLDTDRLRPGDGAVLTRFSFTNTVEDILGLLPETSEVVAVFGASDHERRLAALADDAFQAYAGRFNHEFTNDLSLGSLQRMLAGLPAGSVVFYGVFDSDINGLYIDNYSGLSLVRAASSVPVFGPFDDLLGRGIVGGRLIQLDVIGREMALTAENMLHDPSRAYRLKVVELSDPVYDWRELQAWGIDAERLPPDSVIRFKPPSMWEQYAGWIALAAFAVVAQSLLLGALLLQYRRRQRAERASVKLSRRLITAHEDERRLLARELHDDLSQRLARVAIDASYVASNRGSDAANEVLKNLHPDLVRISKDVHDMSYRLHPSLVDDLGIGAALRAECDRLRRLTDATIHANICEVSKAVAGDTVLCVYRIAQEALSNAIKHAGAETIEISLKNDSGALQLSVRDDGVGFDIAHGVPGSGLGVSSMHERAQLVGGSLRIRSQPGKGTTVSASVPCGGLTQ